MATPRGIRNNNPGNIRYVEGVTSTYLGCVGSDGAFCIFDRPENGLRALGKLLLVYQDKHGLRTVRGIINRWAPTVENNTSAYVTAVAGELVVAPDVVLDLHSPSVLAALATAIVRHENGQQPYPAPMIQAAARAALELAPEIATQPAAPIEERPLEPAPAPAPIPTPAPEPSLPTTEAPPMALPALIPFLASLVPSVINLFAPRLQPKIEKATGLPIETSGPILLDLFNKLGQATNVLAADQTVTTQQQAVQIAAAANAAPREVIQQINIDVGEYFDRVGVMVDKIHQQDMELARVAIEGKDAAAKRNATRQGRALQAGVALFVCAIVAIVDLGLIVILGMQMYDGGKGWKTPDPVLMAMLGPLLMATIAAFKDLNSYLWDGTPSSNAANAANAAIAALPAQTLAQLPGPSELARLPAPTLMEQARR